jgi:hypothetical protein
MILKFSFRSGMGGCVSKDPAGTFSRQQKHVMLLSRAISLTIVDR